MRSVGKENVIALEDWSGCIIICLSSVHCHCDTGEGGWVFRRREILHRHVFFI